MTVGECDENTRAPDEAAEGREKEWYEKRNTTTRYSQVPLHWLILEAFASLTPLFRQAHFSKAMLQVPFGGYWWSFFHRQYYHPQHSGKGL